MRFVAPRAAFEAAVKLVGSAVEPKHSIAELRHILLRAEGSTVTLVATDLVVGIETSLTAEVTNAGAALPHGELLLAAVTHLAGETITVESTATGLRFTDGGRRTAKCQTAEVDRFPTIGGRPMASSAEIPAEALRAALRRVAPFAMQDPSRPHMAAVNLILAKGLLRAQGTDGKFAGFAEVEVAGLKAAPKPLLIPDRVVALAMKVLPADGPTTLRWGSEAFALVAGRTTIHGKLVDAAYPSLASYAPKAPVAVVNRKSLLEACVGALALHREGAERPIHFTFDRDAVTVTAGGDATAGAFEDSVPVEARGPTPALAVPGASIVTALRSIEADTVHLEWERLHPLYLWPAGPVTGEFRLIAAMKE